MKAAKLEERKKNVPKFGAHIIIISVVFVQLSHTFVHVARFSLDMRMSSQLTLLIKIKVQ